MAKVVGASGLVHAAEESGWVPVRTEMITGTYHSLAIVASQSLFPPEPPRQDAKSKQKSAKRKQ